MRAVAAVNSTSTATTSGSSRSDQPGTTWYHHIRPASTSADTAKSTSETSTAEKGKISRGKYTFVTRLGLLVRDVTENRSADEKKFHATRPQKAYTGYGRPTSITATRVKITEKIRGFTRGMKIAHPNPMTVCLYRSKRSRDVIRTSNSRYSHCSAITSRSLFTGGNSANDSPRHDRHRTYL